MNIDGIQTICPEQEIVTAASDRHQHLDVFPILDDQHVAGLFAFHRCFINNICKCQAVLRQRRLIIALHNSDRTLCCKFVRDPLACQRAACFSRMLINRFLDNGRCTGDFLDFLYLLSAAGKYGHCHYSRQGKCDNRSDTFFHSEIPLFHMFIVLSNKVINNISH